MTLILPLLVSNGSWGSSLPECEGSPSGDVSINYRWDNCQGTLFYLDSEYIGEFKDGLMHGQGTMTYTDGTKDEGIWREGEFLYENIVISNEDEEFCQEIGFTINTPEYDNCVQKSAEKD